MPAALPPHAARAQTGGPPPTAPAASMKLLLIEDNPAMQATLARSFGRSGMQVVVCGDGARALDRWRQSVPDVVLLDLGLPGVDGLEVLARARAEGLATPVLVLTARATVGDRVLGLDTGADDYLAKPFDLDELEARVRALARRAPAGPGAAADAAPAWHGLRVDAASGAVWADGAPLALAPREAAHAARPARPARPGGGARAAVRGRLRRRGAGGAARGDRGRRLPPAQEARADARRPRHPARAGLPAGAAGMRRAAAPAKAADGAVPAPSAAQGAEPPAPPRRPASLRRRLLATLLPPVLALIALDGAALHRQALRAADTAYDRTLLASARSIGERLAIDGTGEAARLRATVPYSALETFEADGRSRMAFRVTGFDGETVAGYADLPAWHGRIPAQGTYAALVDFYDDRWRGDAVRVAVLLQPLAGAGGAHGVATVQVAETLELRRALARQLLVDTLWRQALLLAVIALLVVLAVEAATRPVRRVSAALARRAASDLSPIDAPDAPRELRPLLDATTQLMARLARLLDDQKRFVRDAAHQLRTPLAVLKTQVQSAQRGDSGPDEALREIGATVDGATGLANRMLALARVEQLRAPGEAPVVAWDAVLREVALDLAPLVAARGLDFELEAAPAAVRAQAWALRELVRNLLHNAVRHSPPGGRLALRLAAAGGWATLVVADDGPGIAPALRERLYMPFASGEAGGSGLGLAICRGIVDALGGEIALQDRVAEGRITGLDARVRLPLAENAAP